MKILITGFTQRMCNSQKLRYDYLTSVYILADALRESGHEVDHRAVKFGEDLSSYHLALVGIGPPKSLTARHTHEACWTLLKAKRAITYCDDWSIAVAGGNMMSALRCMPQWSEFMKFSEPEKEAVVAGLTKILAGDYPMLAPMFPWGDHTKLVRNNLDNMRVFAWDPTPLVNIKLPYFISLRQRRWVYATLQDHNDWLKTMNPQWPVCRLGAKSAGDTYYPEAEVLENYATSWGVLCPEYKSAGSGWWRVRYHHAAVLGNVLKCGLTDALSMDFYQSKAGHSPYSYRISEIEKMDTANLHDLAEWQSKWFFDHTVNDRAQTLAHIDNALENAVVGS
jgi:hypothetical protein